MTAKGSQFVIARSNSDEAISLGNVEKRPADLKGTE
jgi:hypothetical protein